MKRLYFRIRAMYIFWIGVWYIGFIPTWKLTRRTYKEHHALLYSVTRKPYHKGQ